MPAVTLIPSDLAPFAEIDEAKALALIDDAIALAARVAPCILTEEFIYDEAAKAIIRQAVLRRAAAGSGAVQTQATGPFSQTVSPQIPKMMFWPSEISELQALCRTSSGGVFQIDTMPTEVGEGYWSAPDAWTPLT